LFDGPPPDVAALKLRDGEQALRFSTVSRARTIATDNHTMFLTPI
jgi:hypothetical protein